MKTIFLLSIFWAPFAHATSVAAPDKPPLVVETPLPADAAKILKTHEAKLAELRASTAKKLEALQNKYAKEGKLDEAVALREKVRALKNILSVYTWAPPQASDIGKKFLLEVQGNAGGNIWGVDTYTSDSNPATAAVHAGVVKEGETGIVEIEALLGQKTFEGSLRNGVTSQSYGPWPVAYRIRKAP